MIWLIGNKGMLGTEVSLALQAQGLEAIGTDREVSILEPGAISSFAEGRKLDWIINCAAYTAVDKAEEEPDLAARLNEEGPGNLARLAKGLGASILHISTDYVFDGSGTRPYLETDPVAPLGAYGRTKAAGEEAVRRACPEHVILRTAWLYGRHGPNFVNTMLRLMATKDRIGVVADQRGSPTWAKDLAAAIVEITRGPAAGYGTFHFTDLGETSWHEFAVEIQRLGLEKGILERICEIDALTTDQYPTKTKRPAYSVLSKDKILRDYGMRIPAWRLSLAGYISGLAAEGYKPQGVV